MIFTGTRSDFVPFFDENPLTSRRVPDGTSRTSSTSHLRLFCLPMSHYVLGLYELIPTKEFKHF